MSRVNGWTEKRYWGYLRSGLRKTFSRYPNKYRVLAASKGGRNQYRCAGCRKVYGKKDVAVDHIEPCGSLKGFEDVAGFVDRMFCAEEGLQVLCTSCHYVKSMRERGFTDEEISSFWFKKLKAREQKQVLLDLNVEPAKNAELRLKQYQENM